MNKTLKTLLDKKAESNNTIDLNAYAMGLEDGFNADNWIKVSDRLPESGDSVLVWDGGDIYKGQFICGKFMFFLNNTVTHWQPLPPAPKD